MSGKDGGHIHIPHPQHDKPNPCQPFMKVCNNLGLAILTIILSNVTKLCDELGNEEAKDDGVIALHVPMRNPNPTLVPQLLLPFIEFPGGGAHVKEHYLGIAVHKPTPSLHLYTENNNVRMGEEEECGGVWN
jgi:hypothetical protein